MMNENLDRKVQVAKADVELSRGHLDRLDEIDNAVYQMCQVLTEDEDLPWGYGIHWRNRRFRCWAFG